MIWHKIEELNNKEWLVTFGSVCTDTLLEQYFVDYTNFITKKSNKIIVQFDLSNITSITILQILKNVMFLNKMKETHKKHLESFKLIIPNYYLSKLMTLTFLLSPPVVPCEIVENF